MDENRTIHRHLAQLMRLQLILFSLLEGVSDTTRAHRSAALVYDFLTDELGALFGALRVGSPEDHSITVFERPF